MLENRSYQTKLETRSNEDKTVSVKGTAIVFDKDSVDMGFIERVERSALDNVNLDDVMLVYGHDINNIIARTSAKTLNLTIDDIGLHFEGNIPDTMLGRDLTTNINNGNLQGNSFGFTIADDDWEERDGQFFHIIKRIGELVEISLTPYPAYKDTDLEISMRSLNNFKESQVKKEKLKRELNKLKPFDI